MENGSLLDIVFISRESLPSLFVKGKSSDKRNGSWWIRKPLPRYLQVPSNKSLDLRVSGWRRKDFGTLRRA